MTEQTRTNLEVARQFVEGYLGHGNLSIAPQVLDNRVQVFTGLKPSGPIDGIEEYVQVFGSFREAFPQVEPLKILDIFATDERVVVRFQSVQQHTKDFFGMAATQRVITFDETHVMRLQNVKIIENIVSATNLEFEMLMAPVLTPLILR
ncbi:MAG: ester cyclase [Cyanobacteriota bacterium]|nr:ester cyclase [Cyanobacteriota bacterium]